jgi:signal transduction histidine kinase
MTLPEQVALAMGIDLMIQQAAVAFMDHQKEQLRQSAEAELKYLSFLGHDLNNNLAAVTLALQSLKKGLTGSPEFAEHAETLDEAQQAVLATIGGLGRLLDAERLRKGGKKLQVVPVNLRNLLRGEARRIAKQAEQKGMRVVVDVPSDLHVQSDPELITLIVQNFLGNAVKFATAGTVRVAAEVDDAGGAGGAGGAGAWVGRTLLPRPGRAPPRAEPDSYSAP